MQINGVSYAFVRGSDVIRDGMYIEVRIEGSSSVFILAEVFYPDQTAAFTLSCFEERKYSLGSVEELINIAKKSLPVIFTRPSVMKASLINGYFTSYAGDECPWFHH